MDELEFHDKLPFSSPKVHTGGPTVKWHAEAQAYMAHPGKWAKLITYKGPRAAQESSNAVSAIGRKDLVAFRTKGRWSATRHVLSKEEVEVWVMYTVTDDPAPLLTPRRVPKTTRRKKA